MVRIGVVTGLASERRIVRAGGGRAGVLDVRCAGADAARARLAAEELAAAGVDGLASFGTGGALAPELTTGTLLLPRNVRAEAAAPLACDPDWRERLRARLSADLAVAEDDLAGSATLITSAAAKRALRETTGAGAVDMESRAVAEVAAAAGLPFVAIRAIADPASRAPPAGALSLIAADGRVRLAAAAVAVLREPRLGLAFRWLARDNARAHRTLGRVAALAGPLLGFV